MRPASKVVHAWLIVFSYFFVLAGTKERGFRYLFKTTLLFILVIVVLLLNYPSVAAYLHYSLYYYGASLSMINQRVEC
jgi:hypothetical protein